MTRCLLCENKEPGLLPFDSIHHRYYRADSQVWSFFFFFFNLNSSCFVSILHPPDLPSPSHYPCLLIGKSITGAIFYLVWRLAPSSSSCSQSYCERGFSCLNINLSFLLFFFFLKLQPGFTSTIVHCSRQDPSSHFQTTEEMWHLEEGGKLRLSTV